jgi:hypothetical protein
MIQQISEFEYLGNSLYKFNSNMNELNVRVDRLYSDTNKWNSFGDLFNSVLSNLNSVCTFVNENSGYWKSSSDLVHNLRGYWEEPIQIVFKNTFSCVANMIEIETWLNDNFPSGNFSPTQIIRCDYICNNYSADGLNNTRINESKPNVLEKLAANYSVSVREVFDFLSYKNQLESLIVVFNTIFRKYGKNSLIVTGIDSITSIINLVTYNASYDIFESSELKDFSQTDLRLFHSYVYQYNIVIEKYNLYTQRNFEDIPNSVLVQFEPKDVDMYTGGRFFFKIRNGRWSYHDYTSIEFCPDRLCNDCYDSLPINDLYKEKDCPQRFKYLLTECEFFNPAADPAIPYVIPNVEMLEFNISDITILDHSNPDNILRGDISDITILDHLFS